MNHLPEEPAKLGSVAPTDAEIRLQALNHTKDKLMSIVGHDLRTAIGGVVSLVDMMDRCLEANNLDEAKRLNGLIRRASCDADDLLNDLVTWTRSHGQNIEFRLEFLDVVELIETETARMRVPSLRKNQTIRVVVSGTGKPDYLYCPKQSCTHKSAILAEIYRNEVTKLEFYNGTVTNERKCDRLMLMMDG